MLNFAALAAGVNVRTAHPSGGGFLGAEDSAIKPEGALEVRNLQMDVPDANVGRDGRIGGHNGGAARRGAAFAFNSLQRARRSAMAASAPAVFGV